MTSTTPKTRWQEITEIWQREQWLYGFVGALAGFIFGVAASGSLGRIMVWFANGFWNEALSIAITVIVLDRLNRIRTNEERKLALFRQVKSRSNPAALEALDQIRHEGWLETMFEYHRDENAVINLEEAQWSSGNLRGFNLQEVILGMANLQDAKLMGANLQRADLIDANLQQAELAFADLQGAALLGTNLQSANLWSAKMQQVELREANLQGAELIGANLLYADLMDANLTRANLSKANLQSASLYKANLTSANLQGANLLDTLLMDANLRNANLENCIFDESTVLPDAQEIEQDSDGWSIYDNCWTPETDMTRYTDLNHPDFWEPEWVKNQRNAE